MQPGDRTLHDGQEVEVLELLTAPMQDEFGVPATGFFVKVRPAAA